MNQPVRKSGPPGTEATGMSRMIDAIARSLCTSTCAYRGLSPCWSIHTNREDAMEWPNPNCAEPGCYNLAVDVYVNIVPRGRFV